MKETLFNTAIRLFKEHGYENVSITMICDECKVTKGCFYYHYPAKDNLLLDYYTAMDNEKLNDVMTEMLLINSNADKLWKIFRYYMECSIELGPDLLKNLLKKDMDRGHQLFPQTIATMKIQYPKFYNIIETLSIDGQQKNEIIGNRFWSEVWEDFSAAFLGILTYWSSNDGEYDVEGRTYRAFRSIYRPITNT